MKWGYHHLRKHPYSNIGNIILGGFSSMISWLGLYDAIRRAILFKQVVKKPPSIPLVLLGGRIQKDTISVSDECWAADLGLFELPVFFPMVFFFAPAELCGFSPLPLVTPRTAWFTKNAMQSSLCEDDEEKKRLTYTQKTELMEEKCQLGSSDNLCDLLMKR